MIMMAKITVYTAAFFKPLAIVGLTFSKSGRILASVIWVWGVVSIRRINSAFTRASVLSALLLIKYFVVTLTSDPKVFISAPSPKGVLATILRTSSGVMLLLSK